MLLQVSSEMWRREDVMCLERSLGKNSDYHTCEKMKTIWHTGSKNVVTETGTCQEEVPRAGKCPHHS